MNIFSVLIPICREGKININDVISRTKIEETAGIVIMGKP